MSKRSMSSQYEHNTTQYPTILTINIMIAYNNRFYHFFPLVVSLENLNLIALLKYSNSLSSKPLNLTNFLCGQHSNNGSTNTHSKCHYILPSRLCDHLWCLTRILHLHSEIGFQSSNFCRMFSPDQQSIDHNIHK